MRASPAILIVALSSGACGGASGPASRAGVRWLERASGEESSTKHERLALPFTLDPQGTNGTVLVLNLLRAAQARGARYISDVAIAIQIRRGDVPFECVSRIVLEGDPAPAAEPPPAPAAAPA